MIRLSARPLHRPALAGLIAAAALGLGACTANMRAGLFTPAPPPLAAIKPIRIGSLQLAHVDQAAIAKPAFAETIQKAFAGLDALCLEGLTAADSAALAAAAGPGAAVLLSPASGAGADQEFFAVLYRTDTITSLDGGRLSTSPGLTRPPFIVRLQAAKWDFTAAVVVAHTDAAKAVVEAGALGAVVAEAKKIDDDVIVVGGLNAGSEHIPAGKLDGQAIADWNQIMWLVTDNMPSTARGQADDRILITLNTQEEWTAKVGVAAIPASEGITDHQPVWAEFRVDEVAPPPAWAGK